MLTISICIQTSLAIVIDAQSASNSDRYILTAEKYSSAAWRK